MAVYEPTKKALGERWSAQASFLGAGATAGLAASLVRVPTEVIKQRMQVRLALRRVGLHAVTTRARSNCGHRVDRADERLLAHWDVWAPV